MAITRKIRQKQSQSKVGKKNRTRLLLKNRLNNLPDSLQLHILTFLDAKQAVQTSLLSRTWVWLWASMPVLDLHYLSFDNLYTFDKFVINILRFRNQNDKLNRLSFTRRGVCSAKILKTVLDYAFSQGVKELDVFIQHSRTANWPVCMHTCSESLTSLKLQSESKVKCPFLGSFKNLTFLHLKGALITKNEPFSGFPKLEKLILDECHVGTDEKILSVQNLHLEDLRIYGYGCFKRCDLTTPNLRFFEYKEFGFSVVTADGLRVLETVIMDFNSGRCYKHEERMLDDLISLFCSLHNAKSLTLLSSIVDLLSVFKEKLANLCSPFRDLKFLKLDFTSHHQQNFTGIPLDVRAYLLQNSPEAKLTMIYDV